MSESRGSPQTIQLDSQGTDTFSGIGRWNDDTTRRSVQIFRRVDQTYKVTVSIGKYAGDERATGWVSVLPLSDQIQLSFLAGGTVYNLSCKQAS